MKPSHEEDVTRFCKGFLSVENTEEDPRDGYFAFYAGKNSSVARRVRAPISWAGRDPDRVILETLRRCRDVLAAGEGALFLRAYYAGETSHAEQLRLNSEVSEAPEPEDIGGGALGAMASALVRTNHQLLTHVEGLQRTVQGYHQTALEMTEQLTLAVTHSRMLEDSQSDDSMAKALEALGPTIADMTPHIITWLSGGEGLPEEPGPRILEGVRRIMAAAQDVGLTIQQHPDAVPAVAVDQLMGLVFQLGPMLGLVIRRAAPPTEPPSPEPPPPQKPRNRKKPPEPPPAV